jgi:flagellar hook-associated protein 3 FlgL
MSMRVTQNTNFRVMQDSLHRSKSRLENLQYQASTLKKLNKPSDDPVAGAKLLELRTQKETNRQFFENAKMIEAFLSNSENALGELGDIVLRAKEVAIGMANGNNAQSNSRLGVAEEIEQLYTQAISIANRRVGDRYLFGGYKTSEPPVNDQGVYQGDDGEMMSEIANDVFLAMNVPGYKAFNTVPEISRDRQLLVRREKETAEEANYRELASERAGEEAEIATSRETGENINLFSEIKNLKSPS